jgi:uncharacterized protein (TIGR01244 family)
MTRRLCTAFLLSILLAACKGEIPDPKPVEIDGVRNGSQVGDVLIAGQPTEKALAELAGRGYKTILTTRGEGELEWDEKAKVDSLGMTFVRVPMPNPIAEISDEQVEQFAKVMRSGKRPMVLHCASGNRVAGLWAVWLVEVGGVDVDEALRLGTLAGMTRIRPVVEERLARQPRQE